MIALCDKQMPISIKTSYSLITFALGTQESLGLDHWVIKFYFLNESFSFVNCIDWVKNGLKIKVWLQIEHDQESQWMPTENSSRFVLVPNLKLAYDLEYSIWTTSMFIFMELSFFFKLYLL